MFPKSVFASPAGRPWIAKLAATGWLLLMPLAVSAQPAVSDSATSVSETRRVRLQPVLRPKESTVRLKPVVRGESAAPKPKPQATPTPEPAVTPTAAEGSVAAVPPEDAAPAERAPGSSVKQPPLPPPLAPGEAPPRTAVAARADRRLAAAQALIDKGEIDEAREFLFQLALEIHGTREGAKALLMAALALDDLQQTKAELREITRAYPSGEVTRTAIARLAELNFILGNYEDSIAAYRDLRKMATTPEQRRQADFRIALALQRSGQYPASLKAFEEVGRSYPDLLKTPEFVEAHAEALMANGHLREAGERFGELESDFPNYESAAKVLLNRGLCAELLGDAGTARRQYALITESYPGTLEANLAEARMGDLQVPLIADAVR